MASSEKILESSELSYEDTLNLFNIPASNLGVSDVKYLTYKPVNQFSSEGNVKFHVPGVGTSYIDLTEVYILTQLRIVRGDGSPVSHGPAMSAPGWSDGDAESRHDRTPGDEGDWSVGPVNYLSHALWDQVEVRFNDRVVAGGQTCYSYKALINTLLCEEDTNESELECSMFYKDTGGFMDDLSLLSGGNSGYKKRAAIMAGSRTVETLAKLDIDVFKVSKYLLNGVSIDLSLCPTSNRFRLLTANNTTVDYKVEIKDISLILKHPSPSNHVLLAHQDVMQNDLSRARYFYTKEELRKFNMAKDTSSYYIEDAYNGRVPSRVVIAFVSGEALSGSMNRNPYHFKNFDVTYMNLTLSGMPTPEGPMDLDFKTGKYLASYTQLYRGRSSQLGTPRITREEFADGYSLFIFDLAPQNGDDFYPVTREGSVRIELRFNAPLPESTVMLTKVTYPGLFEIDYARNIYLT